MGFHSVRARASLPARASVLAAYFLFAIGAPQRAAAFCHPSACSDGDDCTFDACRSELGPCFHLPIPGCTSGTTSTTMPTGVCGDALADGFVSAADAFRVLRRAVGLPGCIACVCDTDGDGSVAADDALLALRSAVGIAVKLDCAPCE